MEQRRLKLNEFKILFSRWKTKIPWVDHLLLGLLYWLESELIDARIQLEVDNAIDDYNLLSDELFMDELIGSLYTETPSKTSTSLPEMRLTAPWYDDTVSERSEP